MFSQILTSFQGFFTRSFWLGSFLPVAVAAALHVAIVELAFPELLDMEEWLDAGFSSTAGSVTLIVAALVVLAYTLRPLVPVMREFLDGRLLPDWLHDGLRQERVADWQGASDRVAEANRNFSRFERMRARTVHALWAAAETGNSTNAIQDEPAITAAESAIGQWRAELAPGRLPSVATTQSAIAKLRDALKANASSLKEGDAGADNSERLRRAKENAIDLILESYDEAHYQRARTAHRDGKPVLYPTRLGEARREAERYSEDTYGVRFDVVWPRIQLVLKSDESSELTKRIADARSQVDGAVLMFGLALTVPAFWLPSLLIAGANPWFFLGIGLASPLVLLFLYELVVQTQHTFGDVVRGVIDQYRIHVLTRMMRQPLPATLQAERALWRKLRAACAPGNDADLSYRHPQ